jgi:hypothetical protein
LNEKPVGTVPTQLPDHQPDRTTGGPAVASVATAVEERPVPSTGEPEAASAARTAPAAEARPGGRADPEGSDEQAPRDDAVGENGMTVAASISGPAGQEDGAEPAAATSGEAAAGSNGSEPRRRRRPRLLVEGGDEGEGVAVHAPTVRFLAVVAKEMNEAQRSLELVTAERDRLRQQLTEAGLTPVVDVEPVSAVPVRVVRREAAVAAPAGTGEAPAAAGEVEGDQLDTDPRREAKLAERTKRAEELQRVRAEAKAAKQAERAGADQEEFSPEELATRAEEAGRRRRRIALVVVLVAFAALSIVRAMDIPVGEYLSKGGLAATPIVGPLFQLMIVGFLLNRIFRVGGQARGWLFPTGEPSKKRRRRR